ncbi:MAG: FAD-dependent oxidoreductase [Planctomycetota bacterium]
MSVQSTTQRRVMIVGGGVVGLSIAWELARRPIAAELQITLVDRHAIDAAMGHVVDGQRPTTWAAAGILPPANFDRATDPIDQLRGYAHSIWPLWCNQLFERTGIDAEYSHSGGLYLSETRGEAALMSGMVAYWNDLDIDCQSWTPSRTIESYPFLKRYFESNADASAWWTPAESLIRPPRLLAALVAACRSSGVKVESQKMIGRLEVRDQGIGVTSRSQQGEQTETLDDVILCGGSSLGLIDPQLRLTQSIIPVRGQMLLLRNDHPDAFHGVVNAGNRYLVGRGDGHVLVGSCEEEVGFVHGTTDAMMQSLRQFAGRLNPDLLQAPEIARWSGLRPMTFDGFPMLGPIPGKPRVMVAGGHYRSGISLAPATAVAIADQFERKPSFMDLTAFAVGKQMAA